MYYCLIINDKESCPIQSNILIFVVNLIFYFRNSRMGRNNFFTCQNSMFSSKVSFLGNSFKFWVNMLLSPTFSRGNFFSIVTTPLFVVIGKYNMSLKCLWSLFHKMRIWILKPRIDFSTLKFCSLSYFGSNNNSLIALQQ